MSVEVRVGLGSCGVANGARPVWEALVAAARQAGAEEAVKAVGCGGGCHREPLVEVVDGNGLHAVYTQVTPELVPGILRRHLRPRGWARRLQWGLGHLAGDAPPAPCAPAAARQTRLVLENCGEIDPLSLDEYRARGGYRVFAECLESSTPEEVIAVIESSGLRGRGGAGFPTARK